MDERKIIIEALEGVVGVEAKVLNSFKRMAQNSLQGISTQQTWDHYTNQRIATLHPKVKPLAILFINQSP